MPDELRPYGGHVPRDRPLFEQHVSQWNSTITVTLLDLAGHGATHEVRVTRMGGPKLSGTPDPVGVTIAQVDDVIAEREFERAREIALRAVDELRAARVPDLKTLQQTVRGGPTRAGDL